MSTKTIQLTPALSAYLLNHSLHEAQILTQLRDKTQKLVGANMQISPEQGQFMALLVELIAAKKTLDIGTFTGYSALVVALALPEDGKVFTCDINNQATTVAIDFWQKAGVSDKVELILAPAIETLDKMIKQGEAGSFDFVFIDADKLNYKNYYEKSLTLLRTGGLIAIDNVLWDGKVIDETIQDNSTQAIREFNEWIYQDNRVTMSLLPIGDGLTLARKR